jgi:hypothetical protein
MRKEGGGHYSRHLTQLTISFPFPPPLSFGRREEAILENEQRFAIYELVARIGGCSTGRSENLTKSIHYIWCYDIVVTVLIFFVITEILDFGCCTVAEIV